MGLGCGTGFPIPEQVSFPEATQGQAVPRGEGGGAAAPRLHPLGAMAPSGTSGQCGEGLPAPRQQLPGLETHPWQCSANVSIPTSQEGVNSRLLGTVLGARHSNKGFF